MTRILLAWQSASRSLPRIQSMLPADCQFLIPREGPEYGPYEADPREIIRLAPDADIIMGWYVPRDAIVAATRLRLISTPHAGVDRFDFHLLREKSVMLCNARGVNAIPVAEHAMTLMLALAKRITAHDGAVKRTDWVEWSPDTTGMLLAGTTATVVGMGLIGNEIAKRCKAFDMKVIGVRRRSADRSGHADEVHRIDRLHEALVVADVVMLAIPLTVETRGLIGFEELKKMKPTSLLVNVSRGMIVKEAAVHEALINKRIGGFATDVWWDYSESSPAGYHYDVPSRLGVHRLPNVIGTANVAANVPGMRDKMIDMGVENIRTFLSGQVPERVVDLKLGY